MTRGIYYRWNEPDGPLSAGEGTLIDRILRARGVDQPEDLQKLLHPTLNQLHSPALLPNIDAAADRLIEAIRASEPVIIYGDYDVDGITATTILYRTFKAANPEANVRPYIPHRLTEGYGLNTEAMEQFAADGVRVVVSVDCGITAFEAAKRARELGIDLIITDHHNPPSEGEALPEAHAIVHPRLPGSVYPFGELCGAGVAFKLAWHFSTKWCGSERVSETFRTTLIDLLPLVALATIADVVPLVDENRILTKFGLQAIRQTSITGLNALIVASNLEDESKIDAEHVGFRLAPRLNACGRMGHAREAVRLFTTDDDAEAMQLASELNAQNDERRRIEKHILDEARTMVERAGMDRDDCRIIVLAHETWHPGVVGIVCSRLVERFGRPTILMQKTEEIIKGSARSIPGYSIHAALGAVAEHLVTFGGHDMAAGVSVEPAKFDEFVAAITEHANANISEDGLTPELHIDCAASVDEMDHASIQNLLDLGPFGSANPVPCLLLSNVTLAEAPRSMGGGGAHLAIKIGDAYRRMRLIGWQKGPLVNDLAAGMAIDVVIQPKLNTWMGRTSVEGEIRDLRILS